MLPNSQLPKIWRLDWSRMDNISSGWGSATLRNEWELFLMALEEFTASKRDQPCFSGALKNGPCSLRQHHNLPPPSQPLTTPDAHHRKSLCLGTERIHRSCRIVNNSNKFLGGFLSAKVNRLYSTVVSNTLATTLFVFHLSLSLSVWSIFTQNFGTGTFLCRVCGTSRTLLES